MSDTAVDQLRSTAAVIGDRLAERQTGEREQDIQDDYAPGIVNGDYEYRGRHLRLEPRGGRSWAVLDRNRYLGVLQLTYSRIGDECARYTAKPPGQEGSLDEGWATDWRLAVEWLADEAGR